MARRCMDPVGLALDGRERPNKHPARCRVRADMCRVAFVLSLCALTCADEAQPDASGEAIAPEESLGSCAVGATGACAAGAASTALVENPLSGATWVADTRIISLRRSETTEALKQEVLAAQSALALRAEVGGPAIVYDSPGVSIALQRVAPDSLVQKGLALEAPNKAGVTIPADPRIKGRGDGPVTVTVTSYHPGEKVKELPEVKFGGTKKERELKQVEELMKDKEPDADRVDFFMTKTSMSWRGTVNVKVPGLGASVPAHDREGPPPGAIEEEEELTYPEEKAMIRREMERISKLPKDERVRAVRQLAKDWHPDKNQEDASRAADIFSYLQSLKMDALDSEDVPA